MLAQVTSSETFSYVSSLVSSLVSRILTITSKTHATNKQIVGNVSVCTTELLEQAITSSKAAFRGWADTPAAGRRDIISEKCLFYAL